MRRGKIQIERIDNTASRQVTFTKRRKGLFKKAKELSILCGVDVAVIVFTTTGKLYEFANTDMKSLLEQYSSAKEQIQLLHPTLEAKLWKMEAENLRQQLEDLRRDHRQLMGEDISKLSIEHIENIADQLETSAKALRARKEQILKDKIQELQKQEILVHQENMELHKNLNQIRHQLSELQKKVVDGREEEDKGGARESSSKPYNYDLLLPIQLQLGQAEHNLGEEREGDEEKRKKERVEVKEAQFK